MKNKVPLNKEEVVADVIKRDKLKEQHQYEHLYIFDGTTFIRLKENTGTKYIHTLIGSIRDAERAAGIVNKMNNNLLNEAEILIDGVLEANEISSLQGIIKEVISNQKHLKSFVEDAPTWIENLKRIESGILKEIKEDVELLGKKTKAFREDPTGIFDAGIASEITETRFE